MFLSAVVFRVTQTSNHSLLLFSAIFISNIFCCIIKKKFYYRNFFFDVRNLTIWFILESVNKCLEISRMTSLMETFLLSSTLTRFLWQLSFSEREVKDTQERQNLYKTFTYVLMNFSWCRAMNKRYIFISS